MENSIFKLVNYLELNEDFVSYKGNIICEKDLNIRINSHHYATAMILSTMIQEYVVGFLFVNGLINSFSDIISMKIHNNDADIILKDNIAKRKIQRTLQSNLLISREDIFKYVSAILKSSVFRETEAVHSAGLFLKGNAVSIAEDIGRHNALDKIIGAGLIQQVDFDDTIAVSTGRQPTEMILKCFSAGIPVIATKGVATSSAVELAEEVGITIVGLVRQESMIVYSHPERLR